MKLKLMKVVCLEERMIGNEGGGEEVGDVGEWDSKISERENREGKCGIGMD